MHDCLFKKLRKKVWHFFYFIYFFYFYLNGLLFPQALEKLEHAKENLVKTNEEFENARKRAKKAKASYERIKKERIDKFMTCFEHVSNEIDGIYKVCITRKEKEGVFFLRLIIIIYFIQPLLWN